MAEEIKCMREKYWSEKTDQERILMLRSELQRTQKVIEKLCEFVCKLYGHSHGANNKLFAEIDIGNVIREPIYFRIGDFDK